MTSLTLSELEAKWHDLRSKDSPTQDDLKQLLENCINAGKYIGDLADRVSLQSIARQIGDTLQPFKGELQLIDLN